MATDVSSGIILRCASLLLSSISAALSTAGWVGAHLFPKKSCFASFMILLGWLLKSESILAIEWGGGFTGVISRRWIYIDVIFVIGCSGIQIMVGFGGGDSRS